MLCPLHIAPANASALHDFRQPTLLCLYYITVLQKAYRKSSVFYLIQKKSLQLRAPDRKKCGAATHGCTAFYEF